MTKYIVALLMSFSIFASENYLELFKFQNGESIEIKGEADSKELTKELALYSLIPALNENGKGQITMGAYEYPFFFKRYREVWFAAITTAPGQNPHYSYLGVLTNNPFPRWLNTAFSYKLPTEKAQIDLDDSSFKVNGVSVSMGTHSTYVLYPFHEDLRMEHFENKLVSVMTFQGEAQTREFDEQTDKVLTSGLLKRLQFEPKLWVIRKETSGKVEVPL